MKNYKPYTRLFEAEIKDANDLANEIENTIKKIFPKSFVSVKFDTTIVPGITLYFALGKDGSEWAHHIVHNDPMYMITHIYGMNKDGSLKDSMELKNSLGSYVRIKSKEPKYKAFDRLKTGWRDSKSMPVNKVVPYFETYFKKVKKLLADNLDQMLDPEFIKSKI